MYRRRLFRLRYWRVQRRLEDRIRDLCAKVVATREIAEAEHTCVDLREALREHISRLRKRAAQYPRTDERRLSDSVPR